MSCVQVLAFSTLLALSACGGGAVSTPTGMGGGAGTSGTETGEVELGVPGGPDKLDFMPLLDGAELRLQTFGQGGTHVLLAVRCSGFGSRAFVSLGVRNTNTGTELLAPAPVRPQLLFCNGDVCDLVPITFMMGGLTQSAAERDGLPIEVTADVHNQTGVSGRALRHAVLSTADL